MSKVRGMKGMANNVIYERQEIGGAYLWFGGDEMTKRGHVITSPMYKMVTFSDNDNREHFIMGLPARQ